MTWQLDKNRPLCPQICEQICVGIANGTFAPESRLMSVREMALSAEVNPNTVQRAYEALERDGILYSVRGTGWFVRGDITRTQKILQQIVHEKTAGFFREMQQLGLDAEAVKHYVKEWNE